jgi:hypothetical protein
MKMSFLVGIFLGIVLSVPFIASLFSNSLALNIVSAFFQILLILALATEMDNNREKK